MGRFQAKPGLWLIFLLLIAAVAAVYWPVVNYGFIAADDALYVVENPFVSLGLRPVSVTAAFVLSDLDRWHPLTWILFMTDYEIAGLDPRMYHLTNLLLHTLNTLLLFIALSRLTGMRWRSAFVAALFAVHPLHVESAAWISDRTDVLSTLFWMLTMLAYTRWAEKPSRGRYALVVAAFTAGLMSKAMLIMLPVMLLLLDFWPLARMRVNTVWSLVWEKAALFVPAAAAFYIAFITQSKTAATVSYGIGVKLANAVVLYAAYILKMIWPRDMAVIYPHPGSSLPAWQVMGSAALLICVTWLAIRVARSRPYITVGWLWYIITLLPAIGLLQLGQQKMADRYTYIPLIGLFIIIAWGVPDLLASRLGSRPRMVFLGVSGSLVILLLMSLANTQVTYWRDDVTLWKHTIQVTNRNARAHYYLAVALNRQGRLEQSIAEYREVLKINPNDTGTHNNIGVIQRGLGRLDEAQSSFESAVRVDPTNSEAHMNLGLLLCEQGNIRRGIDHLEKAHRLEPDNERIPAMLRDARRLLEHGK